VRSATNNSTDKWLRIAFIAIVLATTVSLQAVLISQSHKDLANYREPVLGWSTHSMILPVNIAAATDGDLSTFWTEQGILTVDKRNPPSPLPYSGLYLMIDVGMTHQPGKIPLPDPIKGIEILSCNTQATECPKEVRLSYFEQQLYQINHDYRFPDPPQFVFSKDILLENSMQPQFVSLNLPSINPSTGFPDQIKMRWLRIEIKSMYNSMPALAGIQTAAIREVTIIRTNTANTSIAK